MPSDVRVRQVGRIANDGAIVAVPRISIPGSQAAFPQFGPDGPLTGLEIADCHGLLPYLCQCLPSYRYEVGAERLDGIVEHSLMD